MTHVAISSAEFDRLRGLDLQWTADAPTTAGWFWRRDPNDSRNADIVEVVLSRGRLGVYSEQDIDYLDDWPGYEWCGPLEPPR